MNNRRMLLIGALLLGLIVAMMYRSGESEAPPWAECKESLVSQMLFGECTPRRGLMPSTPAPPDEGGSLGLEETFEHEI